MAEAIDRSMNAELREGASDGALKKPNPNRGGFVEPLTAVSRRGFSKAPNGFAYEEREPYLTETVAGVVRGT